MGTEEVLMAYPQATVERAMKMQEVIVRALNGQPTWLQAADILGRSPHSIRRMQWKFEHDGSSGCRRSTAIGYQGFNVRHFHQLARRQHDVRFCYAFVKKALQAAGLVAKHQPRGRHCRRREPRPCFGELLHPDGSRHHWLALVPEQWLTLIAVVDDATKRLLKTLEISARRSGGQPH
jgi:hypothetical protein